MSALIVDSSVGLLQLRQHARIGPPVRFDGTAWFDVPIPANAPGRYIVEVLPDTDGPHEQILPGLTPPTDARVKVWRE